MDARKLRTISVDEFADRVERAQDLTAALDDGFVLTDREEIVGKAMVIVGWELSDGMGGDYVEVWALVMFAPKDVRKIKFRDGGRSFDGIPATLKKLTANGVYGNVRLTLAGEPYEFTDRETGEIRPAVRYTLTDPELTETDAKARKARRNGTADNKDEEPNF